MADHPEIYFHVGLGKVASTYLQQRFFPRLKGIRYLSTHRYRRSREIICKGDTPKWLVSREFDRQFERELRWFTAIFPQARVIMVVRRQGSWVASQYRRYVKNGWYYPFDRFLNLERDDGFWRKSDVPYMPRIRLVEELTGRRPLVLFHHQLQESPWDFLDRIATFCGASYKHSEVSLAPVHTSFSNRQLIVLRAFCRRFVRHVPVGYQNKVRHWLFYRPWWAFFHLILYASRLFPASWVPPEDLIPQDQLDRIDDYYREDWEQVLAYASETVI